MDLITLLWGLAWLSKMKKRNDLLHERVEEMALRFKNEDEFNKWAAMNEVKTINPMPKKVEKNLTAQQDKAANWITALWIIFSISIALIIAAMM